MSTGEQQAALRAVTLLLAAAAVGLLLTHPAKPTRSSERSPAAHPAGQTYPAQQAVLSLAVRRAAERFLAGYLGYVYGRGPSSRITGASGPLARSLQTHPVRVPPGLRALEPRVLRLLAAPAPAGLVGVTAIISDEPTVDYRVGLILTPARGGLLVSGLDGG